MSRLFRHAAVTLAFTAGFMSAPLHAAGPSQFKKISVDKSSVTGVPAILDTHLVKVAVLLKGDPVALVQRDLGRELTVGERQSVISARRSEHQAMMPTIARHGGTVLSQLTGALNGVMVRMPVNQINALRHADGVVDVKTVGIYKPTNVVSVPYIGAPLVWQSSPHYQGQGVKIAIIDTGIDYTHANFGGPGTVAAYTAAHAASTQPADPTLFGPNAPKVKGGTDLVGDAYNAAATAGSAALTPHPDSNPLDCNGHGSHVAGTAAGFGENADGTTFHGTYGAAAYTPGSFKIGPGVAPMADLYAVRVFGCTGSTDVVSEAIDWAVNNGMNVISMSLGSDWGSADNSDSTAVANAIAAGIQVVVAAGNAGPTPYISSAPASSNGAVSVAAMDSTGTFPGATLNLGANGTITVQDNDGVTFANGTTYPIVVLRNTDGTVSTGCNPGAYDPTQGGVSVVGKAVVTVRGGSCARVFRPSVAQHYGAKASIMINNGAGYPPYEGAIGTDPTNSPYEPVTIPFFGALASDTPKLASTPPPATAVANNATVANPTFQRVASFSSGGPRFGDSALRPAVSGPGVSIPSTLVGSGTGLTIESGTSMATPHVAGVAALVKQAHPTWSLADLRAAVVQTASPQKMADYTPRLEGAGVVQALAAASTSAVMRVPNDSLSFGFADLLGDFTGQQTVTIHNASPKPVTFKLTSTKVVGPSGTTVTIPATVAVGANADAMFPVTVKVPGAAVGGIFDADFNQLFHEVGGYIQATPTDSRLNANVTLTVPYYLVAFSRSNLTTATTSIPLGTSSVPIKNASSVLAGSPDLYALGLTSAPQGVTYADVRAVGVQTFPSGNDAFMVFAINTFARVSNPLGALEWDIPIDTTGSGTPNFILVTLNGSYLFSDGSENNVLITGVYDNVNKGYVAFYLAQGTTDTSTILVPVYASDLGLTPASPRFTYTEAHFGPDGTGAQMPTSATFNAFNPALTGTPSGAIPPNGSANSSVTLNAAEQALTPALGLMIVAPDNVAGPSQAQLVPITSCAQPARTPRSAQPAACQ